MAHTVRDAMTAVPATIEAREPVVEAARLMRAAGTGVLVVTSGGAVSGVVTDRDITVRAVAEARDPATTAIAEVASTDVECVEPDTPLADVVRAMRSRSVRRVPVVDAGRLVGIISISDLALEVDPPSAPAAAGAAPGGR